MPLGIGSDRPWYCAYVLLGKLKKGVESYDLGNCTYHDGNVFGVDTNHMHNWNQSKEEKHADSIRQIKEVIKSYNRLHKIGPLIEK